VRARTAFFPKDAPAPTIKRPLPVVATATMRFEVAPAAPVLVSLGVRLPPRAMRRVPVPVLSSPVSTAVALVFPHRAVPPTGGSSAGACCVSLTTFLDLAPTRRLAVARAGAGAGATSTDWLE